LEGSRGVSETEEHNERFKQSTIGAESGFPFVPFLDPNIVVTPTDIEFGEILRSLKLIDEFRNERERVPIFYRYCIQLSVVLYWAQLVIFLLDKEECRCKGGF
ncbi:hypothetical protein PAXINDRAFT_92548, partial [Paxillus involutus ATCC 200175]